MAYKFSKCLQNVVEILIIIFNNRWVFQTFILPIKSFIVNRNIRFYQGRTFSIFPVFSRFSRVIRPSFGIFQSGGTLLFRPKKQFQTVFAEMRPKLLGLKQPLCLLKRWSTIANSSTALNVYANIVNATLWRSQTE